MATLELNSRELSTAARDLSIGDRVYLSGEIYTARDAAHKKMFELLDAGQPLPFNIAGSCIYYAGPTPAKDGMAVGSCGPTTSGRMDGFSPRLLDLGLKGMIGKGGRSPSVCDAIVKNSAVYFCATGGAGALIAKCVKSATEVAFFELGCESLKRLEVERFPLVVAIDAGGRSLFSEGREQWRR